MLFSGSSASGGRASCRHLLRGIAAVALAAGMAAPAAAQTLTGDGSVQCGTPYQVARGDTLSKIARRAYGDAMLYRVLVDANREALGGDPEHLVVGTAITIPCVDLEGKVMAPEAAAAAAASIAAVVKAEGPLSPADLETLFGPVALFPDPVLTPVLVAVTFPLDVVKAGRFVAGASDLSDADRAAMAAAQDWDPSVRELAAGFPDLVTRMSDHIDWTEQAGEAVVAQTDEVLAAIQTLRAKAQENGYLVDNEAQKVEEVNDKIVIAPATPGVVYVPTYDSQVVYTTPVAGPPVYHYGHDDIVYHDDDHWDDVLLTGGIILGGAIILDEIFDDDDWNGWDGDDDIDWDGGDITIDRDEINIGTGDRIGDGQIGNGDRIGDGQIGNGNRIGDGQIGNGQIGNGNRVSIGESGRTQVDRAALANRADVRPRTDGRPAARTSISNPASRDVARQKIATRKSTGAATANLPASRPARASTGQRELTQSRSPKAPAAVSKPKVSRSAAPKTQSRANVFQQPSRSPSMSSNRGRASAGRAGGGGRGGGGGRVRR